MVKLIKLIIYKLSVSVGSPSWNDHEQFMNVHESFLNYKWNKFMILSNDGLFNPFNT